MKLGPHYPTFNWWEHFPRASLLYIVDGEDANSILPPLLESLWNHALSEGDSVVGFDVEWKANKKGEETDGYILL